MRLIARCTLTAVLLIPATLVGCSGAQGKSPEEKRAYVDDMALESLEKFYAEDASLEERVETASGYGVFSSIGTNLIFLATDGGYGKVVNRVSGETTYMKLAGGGVGLGLGVKDFRQLMIFKNEDIIADFIEGGWSGTAEADAAAKTGDSGGEASGGSNIEDDIEVYQMTKNGLALSATVKGVKYYKDDDLN